LLRLVIEDDEGKTIVVPLIRDEITIGRKEGNIIRLTERNVSRRHARLVRAGDDGNPAVLVDDLDSYNGVRLNGDRVASKCTMRPGDLIQIGDYSLALRVDQPAGKDSSADPVGIEGAPTELHHVEPDALPEEKQARLVVVSSNLAGETYRIDHREVIVGRVDENDVVVNHRSISRNHAKVIERDGVFTIIDLASANGVRINNEPFGTATLVNGDIIQLGHVKLRFVAPGDDYIFTPADVDDVEIEAGPSTLRLVVVALLLVAVALTAFMLVRGPEPTTPAKAPVTGPPKVPVEPAPTPPEPGVDVDALMAEGDAHLKAERWTEAANVFGRVLQSVPGHAVATKRRKQAQTEFENKRRYDKLRKDIADEQWSDAYFALEDFPAESVYHPRIRDQGARIQRGFADDELERGRTLVEHKSLDGAREVQRALAEKPFAKRQAERLARLIEKAERDATVVARPVEERPRVADRRPKRPKRPVRRDRERDRPREKPPAATPDDVERYGPLMKEALTLMARGQRRQAVKLLEQAHRLRPGAHTPHQRLCAIYKPMGKLSKALHHCKMWLAKETNGSYKPAIRRQIQLLEAELAQ